MKQALSNAMVDKCGDRCLAPHPDLPRPAPVRPL